MSIDIRPMRETDVAGYNACLDAVARERVFLAQVQAPPVEQSRAWIAPHLLRHAPFYVAADAERIVGWCDITPQVREGFTHRGELGMGVLREMRGRGIGRRLLDAALEQADARLERVELQVFASNVAAIGLYESAGFVVEGRLRQARRIDGRYDDIVCMARLRQPRPPPP